MCLEQPDQLAGLLSDGEPGQPVLQLVRWQRQGQEEAETICWQIRAFLGATGPAEGHV